MKISGFTDLEDKRSKIKIVRPDTRVLDESELLLGSSMF